MKWLDWKYRDLGQKRHFHHEIVHEHSRDVDEGTVPICELLKVEEDADVEHLEIRILVHLSVLVIHRVVDSKELLDT